jgi:hypothetical protein
LTRTGPTGGGLVMSVDRGGPEVAGPGQNDVNDPNRTLPFRHAGHARALIEALAFGEEDWIITR